MLKAFFMFLKQIIIISIITFYFFCCSTNTTSLKKEGEKIDSTAFYLKKYNNRKNSFQQKKEYLNKARLYLSKTNEDSIKAKSLSNIAYKYYKLKDTVTFLKINSEALKLAHKTNDLFSIGDTHWSLGEYYSDRDNYPKAYFHLNESLKNFKKINLLKESAMVRRDMAKTRRLFKDFVNSEILIFRSIRDFKKLKDNRQLFHCYSSLGVLADDMKAYKKAIKYYQEALLYLKKVKNKRYFLEQTLNSLGHSYLKLKEYRTALNYFEKALRSTKSLERKATLIRNISKVKMQMTGTSDNIEKELLKSLNITDSLNLKDDIIDSKLSLARYYRISKDTIKMIQYAKEAYKLACEIKNGNLYSESLQLLAEVDKKNSGEYLNRYIQFNDSLINVERNTQNKFTRIEFETDEFKEETERLSQQLIYSVGGSLLVILLLGAIYFIRIQKNKNEKLVLEAAQQKATEEVYLLTLQQQTKLEKEKAEERNRISRELHDGVLGKLFGTRVGLGFLDISEDEMTQKQHQNFLNELQNIEKEIRDVSHQLHTNFSNSEVNFTKLVKELLKEKSSIGHFTEELIINKNVSWDKISELIKVSVYRIIQESLQNIIKHAKANAVSVSFKEEANILQVIIKDDGIGFNSSKKKKGIGLKNMKARLEKLNGILNIISEKEKGTEIQIHIPIK